MTRSSQPWMKFYPADWQGDERLGMCSLAARGLWVELMTLMHKSDPYGHLLVNGLKPSDVQLAALARAPVEQIRTLIHELEQAGVFSRTRGGTIYSRRMTRDEKKRLDGRVTALNGTKTGSRRGKQAVESPSEKLPPPRVVSQPPPHPESRSQSLREEPIRDLVHRSRANPVLSLHAVLDPMTARRFADHCAAKRKPLSAEQAEAICGELRAASSRLGMKPIDAIEMAIGLGWSTFRVDWAEERQRGGGQRSREPTAAELATELARRTASDGDEADGYFEGSNRVITAFGRLSG